jgi:succinate dehydrogenase/fumarate reductase flavoprotein subunit
MKMTAPVNPSSARPSLDCDVLVVGSGAGGLSAAVTAAYHGLKVVVVEKADVCGGATSWSGGWAWTPGNPLAKAAGVNEDRELFRTYLRHQLGRNYQEDRVEAFLEAVPHMVGFFQDKTSLQFVPGTKSRTSTAARPARAPGTAQ